MVVVQLGTIQSGGWAGNVGVFTGQNIQNSWDSHAPSVAAVGTLAGDFDHSSCYFSLVYHRTWFGQPVFDADVKGNRSTYTNV